jgi:hypothetical protein
MTGGRKSRAHWRNSMRRFPRQLGHTNPSTLKTAALKLDILTISAILLMLSILFVNKIAKCYVAIFALLLLISRLRLALLSDTQIFRCLSLKMGENLLSLS